MTFYEVYVGDMKEGSNEPFSLKNGDWNGHAPSCMSILFPPVPRNKSAFSIIRDRVSQEIYKGAQTDWGTWVAVVRKQQITTFLSEVYGDELAPLNMEHLNQKLKKLREFVTGLDENKHYALVAQES